MPSALSRSSSLLALILCAACASSPRAARAPWDSPPLAANAIPRVYVEQWNRAENRAQCGLFAFAAVTEGTARAATFSGGWAVAYDLPGTRSAFGIAGTGVEPTGDTYSDWPNKRTWADGSSAGYGPEGGSGPNQLAYVRIAGEGCLYNVWSRLGREHLETLLDSLRRVKI